MMIHQCDLCGKRVKSYGNLNVLRECLQIEGVVEVCDKCYREAQKEYTMAYKKMLRIAANVVKIKIRRKKWLNKILNNLVRMLQGKRKEIAKIHSE